MTQEHIQTLVDIGYALANIQADLEDGNLSYEQWDRQRMELLKLKDDIALQYAPAEYDHQYWTKDALQ